MVLLSVFKSVDAMHPSKDVSTYWQILSRKFLDSDDSVAAIWREEKMASVESIKIARKRPSRFLRYEKKEMKDDYQTVYDMLHRIYQKHLRKHRENGDSKQMCCMWSTNDPPDIIMGTLPFDDIEDAFGIVVDNDAAIELYDMDLDEAARKIMDMRVEQYQQ